MIGGGFLYFEFNCLRLAVSRQAEKLESDIVMSFVQLQKIAKEDIQKLYQNSAQVILIPVKVFMTLKMVVRLE